MPWLLSGRTLTQNAEQAPRIVWCHCGLYIALKFSNLSLLNQYQDDGPNQLRLWDCIMTSRAWFLFIYFLNINLFSVEVKWEIRTLELLPSSLINSYKKHHLKGSFTIGFVHNCRPVSDSNSKWDLPNTQIIYQPWLVTLCRWNKFIWLLPPVSTSLSPLRNSCPLPVLLLSH